MFHKQCQQCSSINDMFDEVDEQTLRDCRTDTFRMDLKGQVLRCRYCLERRLPDNLNSVSTDELSNMVLEGGSYMEPRGFVRKNHHPLSAKTILSVRVYNT